MEHIYDIIIIGGGPGGYTAAIYASRAGFDTLVIERMSAGGQMTLTDEIDNYPGFENGVDGFSLGVKMQKGAERFGTMSVYDDVLDSDFTGHIKKIRTAEKEYLGRTVIIATGANSRELGVKGEDELVGKGIHYCAHCDGRFYKGKTVMVVGGGNSAVSDALYLSRIAQKVIVVHRRDTLKATKVYHEPLMKMPNVSFVWNSTVDSFITDGKVRGAKLKNLITGETEDVMCDGIFVSIGRKPVTDFLHGQLEFDGTGYIVADESTKTNVPGVFAVGDVRTKALRQIVTAVSDGAVAVHYAEEYLNRTAEQSD